MTSQPEEKPNPLRFNWHEERDSSFLHWMILNIVTVETRSRREGGKPGLRDRYERLSEATSKFTDVELGITINGLPVDAKAFVDRLEEAFERETEAQARRIVAGIPKFQELDSVMATLRAALLEQVQVVAGQLGIELSEYDFDRY